MAAEKDPQDILMPQAGLRAMLKHAKDGPMSCAFALTKEKAPLLLVDRLLKPKKVRDLMKKEAGDAFVPQSLRFGTVVIKDDDPSTLNFTVNKPEVGGTITALVKLAKKISYQGVVINADEALDAEDEAEAPAPAATTAPPPPPPPPPRAQQRPATPTEQQTAPPPPPSPPPPPPQPATPQQKTGDDLDALRNELGQLLLQVPNVAGNNPMLRDPLLKIGAAAQNSLKAGDAAAAGKAIAALRQGLQTAAEQAKLTQQAQGGGGAVTYAKSRLAWIAVRKKVEGDIEKLRAAILDTYKDEGIGAQLEKAYQDKVSPVLGALDESLADKLDEATNATDATARAKLVAEAKAIIGDYTTFLNSDKTIADLDANPFVPLSIQQTIAATLSTLSKAIH